MTINSLDPAGPESYPTFWDDVPAPVEADVAAEEAYTTFMNLVEDDGVDAVTMDDE